MPLKNITTGGSKKKKHVVAEGGPVFVTLPGEVGARWLETVRNQWSSVAGILFIAVCCVIALLCFVLVL